MAVKKTRITVEIESMTILRSARLESGWCAECEAEVQVITLAKEGGRDPEGVKQIEQWQATKELHGWVNADGVQQMCLKSLMRCMDLDEGFANEIREQP